MTFLGPFAGENGPTERFLQSAQTWSCWFYPLDVPTHLPCPTLSGHAEPISQGYCWKL